MKSILTILAFGIITIYSHLNAQGCVAIRSQSCSGNFVTGSNQTGIMYTGDIVASLGYRHFKSFRHFRGNEEEANRIEEGTEVINLFHGFDLGLSYGITDRFSATLILPFATNDRSSMYEHYGNSEEANPNRERFHTQSAGLGDVRLSASYWLFDHESKGNLALGATVKFPTGKADVLDDFHKLDDNDQAYVITQPVDQSIQLGDDAFGFGLELQGFQSLLSGLSLYYNGSYLATPRNTNNTLRRANANPDNPFSYFSCPDQYAARLGFLYSPVHKMTVSLGGRIEGIPSSDLFGESEGFRRPGYAISVEPGVSVLLNRFALSVNVPVAIERNRVKSTSDIINGGHGDAAFADYVINATVTYLITQDHVMDPME